MPPDLGRINRSDGFVDKDAITIDLVRDQSSECRTGSVGLLKGEILFVCEFLIRTVDSFVVASTVRENNEAPGVCRRRSGSGRHAIVIKSLGAASGQNTK